MSHEESQRRSLQAALGDVGIARVVFDNVAAWVASVGGCPVDPLGAEVWVFDHHLSHILLVRNPWRGWVPPGGKVEPGEAPREAARRELGEETGVDAELFAQPAGACVRSFFPGKPTTLSLSYATVVDSAVPLTSEPGQPTAWMSLDHAWESWFPDDVSRMRDYAQWLAAAHSPTRIVTP